MRIIDKQTQQTNNENINWYTRFVSWNVLEIERKKTPSKSLWQVHVYRIAIEFYTKRSGMNWLLSAHDTELKHKNSQTRCSMVVFAVTHAH